MYKEYLNRTGECAETEMLMMNAYPEQHGLQYYLIVEGDSDERFFGSIINCQKCKVRNLEGKDAVLGFIADMNKKRKKGYLAIVDADFEHVMGITSEQKNLIITDKHDLEMLIFSSGANMRRIYSELAAVKDVQDYEARNQKPFIDSIIDAAYEIGLLKLVNVKCEYRINMKDIPYCDVIDSEFNVNIDELISRLNVRNNIAYDIKSKYENLRKKMYDKYQIACGHDVTEILAMSVTSVKNEGLGYGKNRCVNKNRVEELLRATYNFENFLRTDLFKSIIAWENENEIRIIDLDVLSVA